MQDTATGVPPVIPFEKFKAAAEALGITAKGVYRIEIDTDKVRVHRFAMDDEGRKLLHGSYLIRLVDTVPLAHVGQAVTG